MTLVVDDYDEALAFYVDGVGFELVEDTPAVADDGTKKRWLVIRPPGGRSGLLLAQAADDEQRAVIGKQHGGRVGFFLNTDDFEGQQARMVAAGVRFDEPPRHEPYGTVAVWEDLYGNKWDLIQPTAAFGSDLAPFPPADDIGEILIGADELAARVTALGAAITEDYRDSNPLLISVLKGSLIFVADLMRAIHAPLEIDFLAVSSYGAATKSSGVVRIIKDLDHDVAGRDVILVEDIVDSGLTLRYLLDHLSSQRPASLRTCSLLVREDVPEQPEIDYVGFTLPPAFVIGYGLDVAQQYRHLPYIASYAKA